MPFNLPMTTPAEILAAFNRYSIEGCDGVITSTPRTVGGGIKQITNSDGATGDLVHNRVKTAEKIAFVELLKSTTRDEETAAQAGIIDGIVARKGAAIDVSDFPEIERQKRLLSAQMGATVSVRGKSTLKTVLHRAPTGAAVPCHFLPWNPTGGAVSIHIPRHGAVPASNQHPILFLTAALSGCSIYVKGPADSPTIFHCGTAAMTTGASASAFWDGVMRQLDANVDAMGVADNKDYMVPMRGGKQEVKSALAREGQAKKILQRRHNDALDVEKVNTWGAVFGVRTGANWAFYMQENCTVTYHKIRKTKYLGRRVDAGEGTRVYSRPIVCREIFPNGGARAECFEHLRLLKV